MELGNLRELPNLKPAAFINLKLKKKKKIDSAIYAKKLPENTA